MINLNITSALQLFQFFGSSTVNFSQVTGIENVAQIYSYDGESWLSWSYELEQNNLHSFERGRGYVIISKDQDSFTPYSLSFDTTYSLTYANFFNQDIEIFTYYGNNIDLDSDDHYFDRVAKPVDGNYVYWRSSSENNDFNLIEDGETYMISLKDNAELPILFSENILGSEIYALTPTNNSLSVFNTSTGLIQRKVDILEDSTSVVFDNTSGLAFVISGAEDSVQVIDIASETLLYNIRLTYPDNFAPDLIKYKNNLLYVSSSESPQIMIIDPYSSKILETLDLTGKINGAIIDLLLVEESIYVLTDQNSLIKIEDTPFNINKFDYFIRPDSFDQFFTYSFSVSDDGEVICVQNFRNKVSFYHLVDGKYERLMHDVEFPYDVKSVHLSGNGSILVVGSHSSNNSNETHGAISTFAIDKTNRSFSEISPIIYGDNLDPTNYMCAYGIDLNKDGSFMVMSSKAKLSSLNNKVALYKFNSSINSWEMVGTQFYGDDIDDSFGSSVSINAYGDVFTASSTTNNGYVNIFSYDPNTDTAALEYKISGESNESFGSMTKLNETGSRLFVSSGNNSIKSFDFSGVLGWVQSGDSLVLPTSAAYSQISVSQSGKTLIVGSLAEDNLRGTVRIYRFENNNWSLVGDPIYGVNDNDRFGFKVSCNGDGTLFNVCVNPYYSSTANRIETFTYGNPEV